MNEQIKRGPWLIGFLIIAFIISLVGVISRILLWQKLEAQYPTSPHYILTTITFLRPISILAIWFWSRTGVIAYILLSVVAIITLFYCGIKLAVLHVFIIIFLIILIWSKWKYMPWSLSASLKVSTNKLIEN